MDNYIRKALVDNVVDGDTFDAWVDLGYKIKTHQRFRMLGVDTPEKKEDGWAEAKGYMTATILNKDIYLQSFKSDSFGRYLAEVYIIDPPSEFSLNDQLIFLGLAEVYVR